MREIAVTRNDGGQRLDRFLRKLLPSATLGHLFKLVRKGRVKVNGKKARPETRLEEGDQVALYLSDEHLGEMTAARGRSRSAPVGKSRAALSVLHRDEDVLAVDKPPMLVVQPGGNPDEPTLEDLVRERVGPVEGLTFKPSLAHRLDRGTSGVVLFGVSAQGLRGLTALFRQHGITKRYLALVQGEPESDAFTVDASLLRGAAPEGQGAFVRTSSHPDAQKAVTDVSVRARSATGRFALVEARPRTGRTHQIRVHLRSAGLPIVGDSRYGRPRVNAAARDGAGLWRPFLHAWRVEFEHPVSGRPMEIESPLPADLVRALGWADVPQWRGRP